ncbi:MAG: carbamoyltransferase HypF [Thermoprotei archaeon]
MDSYRILVTGLVQGVGFRPFVYRIAVKSDVKGYVRNLGGSEVEIRIQGNRDAVSRFFSLFFLKLPYPAKVESIKVEETNIEDFHDFKILKSGNVIMEASQIPPDIAVCDECMQEVLDPSNRRHEYPFNSCVHCGPRFSMIYEIPYDRENTSMNDFPLCDDCLTEYYDSGNERRFDAQGISCPRCGPKLFLETVDGEEVNGDPIITAAKLIKEGKIVAVKGIGGFHIAVDPLNDDAVLELRKRKNRLTQPFAVMALDLDTIKKYAVISEIERDLLISSERPIVLLKKRDDFSLSKYVSPGLDREGFFLYYTPLHYLLLNEMPHHVLIMTSGNRHEFPMCISEECIREHLRNIVDYVLYHNRKIVNRVDDSVVRVSSGKIMLLRRGRGYAPMWIKIRRRLKYPIIAVGAELQNAGAVAFDDKIVMTQFIGDTDKLETLYELEKYLNFFIKTYSLKPGAILADKNPTYQSTILAMKFAEKFSADFIQVQHHFAHVLSVAADYGYDEGVGIAIDGIGYGDDGNGWGGEIIRFSGIKYFREYHLKYVPYVGGDINALRPERMLALILSTFMKWDEIKKIVKLRNEEFLILEKMSKKPNLMTSSTGRVLDAASAYLGICKYRSYEGEPAMKLEASARGGKILDMEIPVKSIEIDTTEIFKWLLDNNARINDTALTIQYRLGEALIKAALKLNPQVVFVSGGAAVNEYILKGIMDNSEGIPILTPRRIPAGDGGIALGQAYYLSLRE